jgi:cytochrome b
MPLDDTRQATGLARVWDPFVRLFHWSLVTSFVVAYISHEGNLSALHHWAGYAAGSLVVMRLLWGIVGTRYARFSHFIRHPSVVLAYLRDIVSGREARHIGHNPAGGAMVLALMLGMLATAITGWMETTNAYFGVAWVQVLHSLCAHGLLLLILLHLGGVLLASYRHGESLIHAMITGRKRAPGPHDVD